MERSWGRVDDPPSLLIWQISSSSIQVCDFCVYLNVFNTNRFIRGIYVMIICNSDRKILILRGADTANCFTDLKK